ncbi:fumarylacetoacetate hydrolase family protein [Desulfatitalea tepidiphila]|uniref:fumarylacetoacetate hydrolase family protein n=1 Tax=Desulfatitalea tepidiphila TaxID=1185843 RepID=UPI0006B62378|nr:fumarylacetoacetate hydrolase family protein [Desulfatitalea tepidiphila]
MRLIRMGAPGRERPGLSIDGKVVDLRVLFPEIPDIDEQFFRQGWLERLAGLDLSAHARESKERWGPPIARPSKIICLGKNYAEHAREGGFETPASPLIFSKTPNTLNGPFDPILLPRSSGKVDWEVELALVIGKAGKRIVRAQALSHVAGVTVMNDVSGREAQFADSQWFRGKAFDTFAPMGPALVTLDEIGDPHDLRLTATVNGRIMQDGHTRDLIFDLPALIANISEDITLVPGDVISTGTPAGVGIFRDPPIVLDEGDEVSCWIEKIGAITNRVVR